MIYIVHDGIQQVYSLNCVTKTLNKPLVILGGVSEVVTSLEIGDYYSKAFYKKMISIYV